MKSIIAVLALALSFNAAQAAEKCSESDKNLAIAGYVAAVNGKGKLAKEFRARAKALVEDGLDIEAAGAENVSAVCIQQGVSMHSGQVSSLETFLVVHKLRVGRAGLVNDGSILATVEVGSQTNANDDGESVGLGAIRFVDLK